MLADPKLDDAALTCSLTMSAIRRPTSWARWRTRERFARRAGRPPRSSTSTKKRIDRVSLDMLELRKAPTCEEKKDWVEKLRKLGDARALPALRGLRVRRMGPISWGGTNISCMKEELAGAIAELDKKSGHPAERHTRRGR